MSMSESIPKISIRLYISLLFSTTVIFVIFLFGLLLERSLSLHIKEQIGSTIYATSNHIAERLDSEIWYNIQLLKELKDVVVAKTTMHNKEKNDKSETEEHEMDEIIEILHSIRVGFLIYKWLGYANEHGEVIVSTEPINKIAQKEIIKEIEHKNYSIQFLKSENNITINIKIPIKDNNDRLKGIVIGEIDWNTWINMIINSIKSSSEFLNTIEIFVFNQDNKEILFASNGNDGIEHVIHLKNLKNNFFIDRWKDKEYIIGSAFCDGYLPANAKNPFSGLGLDVIIRQPLEIAYKPIENIKEHTIIISIILSILFGVLGWFLAGFISKPIESIALDASEINQENHKNMLVYNGKIKELSILSSSLNMLIDTLLQNKRLIEEIAKRKRIEKELSIAKTKTEEAYRVKSRFLAMISHEIRTPINAIIGMANMIMDTKLDENQKRYIQIIHSSATSLLGILNDVLDYSKLEANKLSVKKEPFDLIEMINHTRELMMPKAKEKNLSLFIAIDSDIPQFLKGDYLRIEQVLLNLLSNAIKFTETGAILLNAQKIDATKDKIKIRFSVKDSGIGIPKEEIPKLFNEFYQVDSSNSRKYGGTGLGLVISNMLVKLMGGERIYVESELNKGSIFYFELEFEIVQKEQFLAQKSSLSLDSFKTDKKLKILVVDDNSINQEITKGLLLKVGFDVTTVDSGINAIEAVKNSRYDLVLMDIQMPIMDGFETTKRIRELADTMNNSYCKDIPIIALSAYSDEESMNNELANCMNGYLLKPLEPFKLIEAIFKYCNIEPKKELTKDIDIKVDNTNWQIDGIDLDDGLRRVLGDKEAYKKALFRFYNTNKEKLKEVIELYNKQEKEALLRLIHSIKGSSGNIGAKRLYLATIRLEDSIKNNKEVEFNLKEFKETFNELIIALELFIKQENQIKLDDKKKLDIQKIIKLLEKLEKEILNDLSMAFETLKNLKSVMSNTTKMDDFLELERFMDNFDLNDALSLISTLKSKYEKELNKGRDDARET